jgi:hypothetical protein
MYKVFDYFKRKVDAICVALVFIALCAARLRSCRSLYITTFGYWELNWSFCAPQIDAMSSTWSKISTKASDYLACDSTEVSD